MLRTLKSKKLSYAFKCWHVSQFTKLYNLTRHVPSPLLRVKNKTTQQRGNNVPLHFRGDPEFYHGSMAERNARNKLLCTRLPRGILRKSELPQRGVQIFTPPAWKQSEFNCAYLVIWPPQMMSGVELVTINRSGAHGI